MPDSNGARILNVNDTDSARYLVSRILKVHGYSVLEARTGAEAIRVAREQTPDLVVLDIKLPDMSGFDVCRLLKQDQTTGSIAVIQTSATFVSSENKVLGLESGADAYLTQPFEPIELAAMVGALLRLKNAESESRRRADALATANQRKDEFLAMLAHELRNPLSAIMTGVKLIERNLSDTSSLRISEVVQRQVNHLSRLIDDLLDVSRITQGKIELRSEYVDLKRSLVSAVDSVRTNFERRGSQLSLELPDEPVTVFADATRIEQIIVNLLNNAEKYTAQNGHVTIALRADHQTQPACALLTVKDDGIGISREHIGSLFDLFFQADNSLARSRSGLGIGLTMVKRLVELHGGSVSVDSAGEGQGAEFRISLPLIAANTDIEGDAPPRTSEPPRPSPRRVLLVDDNVDSCELFRTALERAGHAVDCAYDGAAGLRMALASPYDAAVIDIGLPELNGFELAQRLNAELGAQRPRLIAMTGYGRPEDQKLTLSAGFDLHLVKPVALRELQRALER